MLTYEGKPLPKVEAPEKVNLSPKNPNQKWQIRELLRVEARADFLTRGFPRAEKYALESHTRSICRFEYRNELNEINFQHIPFNPTLEHLKALQYQTNPGIRRVYVPNILRSDIWTISTYGNEWINLSTIRYNQVAVGPQGQIVAIFNPISEFIGHDCLVVNDTVYDSGSDVRLFAIRANGSVSVVSEDEQGNYINTIIEIIPQ